MKFGIALARLNPAFHVDAATAADALGFESLWMSEHLVFTVDMSGSPHPGDDTPPVPPSTPVYDVFGYLAFLAGRTQRIRLGTNVYLMALRHPFAAARAVQTLDILSGGRAEIGIGVGPGDQQRFYDPGVEVAARLDLLQEEAGVVLDQKGFLFSPQRFRERIGSGMAHCSLPALADCRLAMTAG